MSKYDKYIGQLFDDVYRIDKIIGIGGTSVVFEAYDTQNDRKVAIKMLREEMNEKKDAIFSFINESKTVSTLEHENIVEVYRVNTKGAAKYMVMERIEGVTLKKYMDKKGALSFALTLSIAKQTLDALEHAHEKNIIHRDIKPQNIMLKKNGAIVVTDFGIAAGSREPSGDRSGKAVGTVDYISPEQAEGKSVDKRSDIYSLGIMMYEMITGHLPFTGDNPEDIAYQHVHSKVTPPHDFLPTIPTGLEQIILHAIEKDPEKRFSSAKEMIEYIEELEEDPFATFTFVNKSKISLPDVKTQKKDEKERKKKAKKKMPRAKEDNFSITPSIIGIFCAVVCVAIVGGVYILLNIFPDSALNVFDVEKVEDVEIQDYMYSVYNDQLYYELVEDGYEVDVEYKLSNDFPENTIIDQTPSAGRIFKKTSLKIKFTVSMGTKMQALGNYTMTDYRLTRDILMNLDYTVNVEYVENSAIEIGYVISTLPAPGTIVEYGSHVTLYVSSGAKIEYKQMPEFVGKSEAYVYAIMKSEGYRTGQVKWEYSSEVEKGYIISQSIEPGMYTAQGSIVSLVISLGTDPSVVLPPVDTEIPVDPDVPVDPVIPA